MQLYNNGNIITTGPHVIRGKINTGTYDPNNNTSLALLNINASLLGLDTYHNTNGGTNWDKWVFRNKLNQFQKQLLKKYKNSEILIHSLLESKHLQLAVSNSMEDVKQITSTWNEFNLDEEGLNQASKNGSNTLYACAKLAINIPNWSSLGRLFEGSESILKFTLPFTTIKPNKTYFQMGMDSLFGTTSLDTTQPILFYTDKYNHKVASYFITFETHRIEVRITDLYELQQQADQNRSTIDYDEIVVSHEKKESLIPITTLDDGTPVKGFIIKPVKIPMTNPMNAILDAKKGERFISGVQADGFLQINKKTPFNHEVRSVVVETTRGGCGSINTDGYYKFYNIVDYRNKFNLLIEFKIDDILIGYTTCDQTHRNL
jgi:hypothetical protein